MGKELTANGGRKMASDICCPRFSVSFLKCWLLSDSAKAETTLWAAIENFVNAFRDAGKGGHAFPIEDADMAAARIGEGFGQGIVRCIRIGGG